MGLYASYLRIHLRGQLERRSAFAILVLGQAFVPLLVLAGAVLMFDRFGTLGGWTRPEALLCYGVAHMAFAAATCLARGFDTFSSIVANGEFDRILLRPRGTIVQVLGQRFDLSRSGRLLQGAAVLAWAVSELDLAWDFPRAFTLAAMIASGTAIFCGIYVLGAALCFKTVQGLEVVNILTDGGREASQYPLAIFPEGIVKFFTYVVPFACFNYIPLLWILGKPGGNMLVGMLAPWLGALFLLPCAAVWRRAVRSYVSTGS